LAGLRGFRLPEFDLGEGQQYSASKKRAARADAMAKR
jgi:hypothetical protein